MKFGEIDLTSSDPGQIIYTSATDAIVGNNNLFWNSTDNSLLIGNNTATPEAILNLTSTTQGVYLPSMTEVERDAISSPQSGLMIFNTDTNQFNFYDGSSWQFLFVGYPSCIQDSDNDTSICVSNFNDITVSLGDDGTYADNTSLISLSHSGCVFAGSPGPTGLNPGTTILVDAGDGGPGAGPGQGGNITCTAGTSGDTFSAGGSLLLQGGQSSVASGGSASLIAGNSTTNTGGNVNINGGTGDTTGGAISIVAGASSTTGDGGNATLESGSTFGVGDAGSASVGGGQAVGTVGSGGDITIGAGFTSTSLGDGGNVNIESGVVFSAGNPGDAGNILITAGYTNGTGSGGSIRLEAGSGTTDGAIVIATLANDTAPSELRFLEDSGSGTNYVGIKAPNSISSNVMWTLPSADGSNLTHLTTNGSGTLSWSNNRFTSTFTTAGGTGIVYAAGVLTITHSLTQYLSSVVIISNTDTHITPSSIVYTSSSVVTVNISAFDPIPGTWRVVIKV